MSTLTLSSQLPAVAHMLSDQEYAQLRRMWSQWAAKHAKNTLLTSYYDFHRSVKHLGISIPPQLQSTNAALGWPAKAVQALSRKHIFEGFTLHGATDPFDTNELLARNHFTLSLAQAFNACYEHACSFVTVTKGDTAAGEPEAVVQVRNAEYATGLWDSRRWQLSAAMTVNEIDEGGMVTEFAIYTTDAVIVFTRDQNTWTVERLPNRTNRVLVDVFVNDPQLARPFGHSKITREVRYLTDAAVRTLVRTEASAEFFSSPQRWVTGASEDAFKNMDRWTAVLGRVLSLGLNDEGDAPTVGQFPQMSMEPHLAMYRQLAKNFCAATNLPESTVGIFPDNPASAEAMQAAEYWLSDEAEYQWRVFSHPLRRVLQNMVMVRDGLSEPPAESWAVEVKYTPARYVSPQAASDYIVKVASAFPEIAGTNVAYRRAGFTQTEIDELAAEVDANRAAAALDAILAAGEQS